MLLQYLTIPIYYKLCYILYIVVVLATAVCEKIPKLFEKGIDRYR
jgi:hypothetical protein